MRLQGIVNYAIIGVVAAQEVYFQIVLEILKVRALILSSGFQLLVKGNVPNVTLAALSAMDQQNRIVLGFLI